jgi:penicillin-binding protein 2
VIVENGGHGGSAAAPVARQLFDQYLLNSPVMTAKRFDISR